MNAARFCPKTREYTYLSSIYLSKACQNGFVLLRLSKSSLTDICLAHREKKIRKNSFDLRDAIHEPEYQHIERPIDTRTKEPIEPLHRFEVTLEPDKFTEEK